MVEHQLNRKKDEMKKKPKELKQVEYQNRLSGSTQKTHHYGFEKSKLKTQNQESVQKFASQNWFIKKENRKKKLFFFFF